jgi:hypothetical protein
VHLSYADIGCNFFMSNKASIIKKKMYSSG